MAKKWHESLISGSDIEKVTAAVRSAELRTTGEIVPMIVRRSSVVGGATWLISLILFFTLSGIIEWFFRLETYFAWSDGWWAPIAPFVVLLGILALSFVLGRYLGQIPIMQRWFTPGRDLQIQVEERALLEFHLAKLEKTKQRTAILIFLSLMERRAVVLADHSISEKLSQDTWAGVLKALIDGIHQGKPADGLIMAIGQSGELLAQHFPVQPGDRNEISDHLIIKE